MKIKPTQFLSLLRFASDLRDQAVGESPEKPALEQSRVMSEALLREYRVCEEIGRGRFGAVSLCQPLDPTRPGSFAVKTISKDSVSGDDLDSQCLLSEPKILSLLSPHPNIVQVNSPFHLFSISHQSSSQICDCGRLTVRMSLASF